MTSSHSSAVIATRPACVAMTRRPRNSPEKISAMTALVVPWASISKVSVARRRPASSRRVNSTFCSATYTMRMAIVGVIPLPWRIPSTCRVKPSPGPAPPLLRPEPATPGDPIASVQIMKGLHPSKWRDYPVSIDCMSEPNLKL